MLKPGDQAASFSLQDLNGSNVAFPSRDHLEPTLLVFFETDCPTCRLTFPYLNRLAYALKSNRSGGARIIGISQDGEMPTRTFADDVKPTFPIVIDHDLAVSRAYDPAAVPTLFLIEREGNVALTSIAFDKTELNTIAAALGKETGLEELVIATPYDGAPASKPGCTSRHLEPQTDAEDATPVAIYSARGARASHVELRDGIDPIDYCLDQGFDPLPVVPPTLERVQKMLEATHLPADEVIGQIPPNYGVATVEKIAAAAVMAGCRPEMLRVLVPLIRAACDERFNLHGVQATTHFAAPLVIVNGPVRNDLGFCGGSNVFSNVGRANSTLGRAFQLALTCLGGARPGEIDMSTQGNAGKFSSCIAENEEESPWTPFHVDRGFKANQSTLSLFAAEPPHGVSEHNARRATTVLKAISRALATLWTYRVCSSFEALVILCPEHVKTIHRDGMSKDEARQFLFENTGIPLKAYESDADGEGVQYVGMYEEAVIDGERCYRKFRSPDQIRIIVSGGTAGKFSSVLGSWATGPRGSEMVIYPID